MVERKGTQLSDPYQSLDAIITKLMKSNGSQVGAEDVPIIQIVDHLLQLGYQQGASDIHIEAHESNTLVRFRVDGIMHDILNIPKYLHNLITTRIKILSRLRTDEHQATQDGKLRFIAGAENVDVRVSIIPANFGEKTVMRILSEKSDQFNLANLGFSEKDLDIIETNADKPWGLILSTGPTGSGKTTSLYGILKKLNRREVNIATIEDPVEYGMEGITQIQVNEKTNLTFARGLRSIVRQDPDIVMVGEIRDEETASVAINAALTGHLVLSTLHTNDSATTIPRLMDMGMQPFLVASTINIAIAQRLVRKLCDSCITEAPVEKSLMIAAQKQLDPSSLERYGFNQPGLVLRTGQGCKECNMSGYNGRLVIAEVLEVDEEIKQLIMKESPASAIEKRARELGMTTMVEDGLEKVTKGLTTLEEILRVAGHG